jgi:hypothetical protein
MFTQEVDMRDIFLNLIQDLKLEARNLNDFNELKRIKGKIENYETRLKSLLPDFDFKTI